MNIALSFNKNKDNKMYEFTAMLVEDVNGENQYTPICQYMGLAKGKVLSKGMSSVRKFIKGGE